MTDLAAPQEEALYERVAQIIETARAHVSRTVDTAMVHAYWLIGREVVEVEQHGKERAAYGQRVVKRLAARLSERFGPGFTASNIKRMRQFYLAFPSGSCVPEHLGGPQKGAALRRLSASDEKGAAPRHQSPSQGEPLFPPLLSWTHYRLLVTVANPQARAFYEIEAARESWATRELERQIASLLYERLAKSRDLVRAGPGADHHRPPGGVPPQARQGLLLRRPPEAPHPRRRPLLRRPGVLQPAAVLLRPDRLVM